MRRGSGRVEGPSEGGGDARGGLWVEAAPGEERVGALAAEARIADPGERGASAIEEPAGGNLVRRGLVRRPLERNRVPFGEDGADHLVGDTLSAKLPPEGVLTARTAPVARFDPGAGKGGIVEHPQVDEAADDRLDEVSPIARRAEAATNLGDRTGARLEEPEGGFEDGPEVGDGGPSLT